jgi:UDP-2,3-diacylglucosamine pyrophosphatase LpxH
MGPGTEQPDRAEGQRQLDLLVISDLHLSAGRDPRTGRISPNEDFLADAQLRRFLEHHQRGERRWHLIVNGDFLDFLQVKESGARAAAAPRGLAAGEEETVQKLRAIADGHPVAFEALARFAAGDNRITVLKGNHDVELHYPCVQEELVAQLCRRAGSEAAQDQVRRNVRCGPWFYFEAGQLWVEHGNRYEAANSFEHWLSPLLPVEGRPGGRDDEIDLPLGSMFVRYLFNQIERVEPFADNVKPAVAFVGWLLRKHPITAARFAFQDGRYMLQRLRRAWQPGDPAGWAPREEQHRQALAQLAQEARIPLESLQRVDALGVHSTLRRPSGLGPRLAKGLVRGRLALPLVAALVVLPPACAFLGVGRLLYPGLPEPVQRAFAWGVTGWMGGLSSWALLLTGAMALAAALAWLLRSEQRPRESYLVKAARRLVEELKVRHVVMGHTHDADFEVVEVPGQPGAQYFNTGTWTPVFSERERLVRGDLVLIHLRGLRRPGGELELELLEWDDAAGEARPLKLFGG